MTKKAELCGVEDDGLVRIAFSGRSFSLFSLEEAVEGVGLGAGGTKTVRPSTDKNFKIYQRTTLCGCLMDVFHVDCHHVIAVRK